MKLSMKWKRMDPYHTPHTAQRLKMSSHDILRSPLAPSHIHGLHTAVLTEFGQG